MEDFTFSGWFVESILPTLTDFIVPLIPWLFFSVIMVLADWRFSIQLWSSKKDKKQEDKPKVKSYINRIINAFTYVLLAGCLIGSCKNYKFLSVGVEAIATTGLIVWAAIEFTKCFNKYMEIEGMGLKINLFKLFKKAKVDEVLDKDGENEKKPNG
jgi:Na+/H+ antiporter NhaD/arsenite permease-like protein